MTILQLSNLFNQLAQITGFSGYHFGLESDINRNIDNNLNVGNVEGNLFPYVLFEFPTEVQSYTVRRLVTSNILINFFDLHYRNNAGTPTTDTTLETLNALRQKVADFIDAFRTVTTMATYKGLSIQGDAVNLQYLPYQHNDNLLQIQVSMQVTYNLDCPDPNDFTDKTYISDALAAINTDYPTPADGFDYETVIPN